MIIPEINREKGHLVRVKFSEYNDVLLDLDIANEVPLKAGTHISEEKILELKDISDYERAKSRALWYLDRSSRTEKGLYDKLITAGFEPKSCARVISRLKELGLIDDEKYAGRYAERLLEQGSSKREVYAKLTLKGISRDLAKQTLDLFESDEKQNIREVINKKYINKMTDKEGVGKVYAALIRKGFSYNDVGDVLREFKEN